MQEDRAARGEMEAEVLLTPKPVTSTSMSSFPPAPFSLPFVAASFALGSPLLERTMATMVG